MSAGRAIPRKEALEAVADLLGALAPWGLVVAGSVRRERPVVHDVDILLKGKEPLWEILGKAGIEATGGAVRGRIVWHGIPVDLLVAPGESFGAALLYLTGSKRFNIFTRSRAKGLGLRLNEYGLWKDGQRIAGRTEEEVLAALGLPWIPPAER